MGEREKQRRRRNKEKGGSAGEGEINHPDQQSRTRHQFSSFDSERLLRVMVGAWVKPGDRTVFPESIATRRFACPGISDPPPSRTREASGEAARSLG